MKNFPAHPKKGSINFKLNQAEVNMVVDADSNINFTLKGNNTLVG